MKLSNRVVIFGSLVLLCCAFSVYANAIDSGTETLSNASDYLGITPNAAKIRSKIPRPYGGVVAFDPEKLYSGNNEERTEYAKSYGISVGSTLAYGIFLGVVALIVGVVWLFSICCKCCCRCLGCIEEKGKDIEEFANNKRNKIIVLGIIALFVLLITIFLGLGLRYNNQISESITGDKGFTGIVDTLYADGIGTFNSIMGQISSLVSAVSTAADDIAAFAVSGVNTFSTVPSDVANNLRSVGTTLGNINIQATVNSETVSFPCQPCADGATQANNAANEIESQTSDVINELNTGLNQTIDSVLNQKNEIETQINNALNAVNGTVNSLTDDFDKYWGIGKTWIEKVSNGRETTNGVFFGLPLIGVITLIVALLLRSPFLVTTNAVVYWSTWLFLSIPLTLHIPFALIFSDVCLYVEQKEANVTGYLAQARDICLEGEPVAEALNLTQYLNYRNYIDPDKLTVAQDQLSSALNYSELTSFQNQLNAISFADFVESGSGTALDVDAQIALYNSNTGRSATRATMAAEPDSPAKDLVLAYIECENQVLTTLDTLKNLTADVVSQADDLRLKVIDFNNGMTSLLNNVILPLFAATDTLINSFNCKFLGTAYVDMKEAMCHDLLDGVTYVALYAFLVIVFAIPTTFIWCTLATIIRNQNLKEHIEKFENVGSPREMDETGSLPRIRPKGAATQQSPRANAAGDDLDDVDLRRSSDHGDTRGGADTAAPGYDREGSSSGEKD